MVSSVNLWKLYEDYDLDEILKDLYKKTLGKNPAQDMSQKHLLLNICSFYQTLLDNLPGSVFWLDKNDRYIGGNLILLELLGFESNDELLGKSSNELGTILNWTKEQSEDILANNKKVFLTGEPLVNKQEEPFIDAKGKKWIQLTNKVPIKNQNEEVELLLGISLDITDRIRLMNEISEQKNALNAILNDLYKEIIGRPLDSNEPPQKIFTEICRFYKSLLNNLPGSVYWLDKNDTYLGCNQALLDMFSLKDHREFTGMSTRDVSQTLNWTEKQFEDIFFDNKKIFETGQPLVNKQEEPFTDTKGKKWVQLTNKVPIKNEKGEVDYVLGVSIDISDRIKLMQALEKEKDNAEAANKSKTEFLINTCGRSFH